MALRSRTLQPNTWKFERAFFTCGARIRTHVQITKYLVGLYETAEPLDQIDEKASSFSIQSQLCLRINFRAQSLTSKFKTVLDAINFYLFFICKTLRHIV
jgi:hypothetical protein